MPSRACRLPPPVLCALVAATPVAGRAQEAFAGTWTVRAWEPAPWLDAAGRRRTTPDSTVLGARIVVTPRRVTGPAILGCTRGAPRTLTVPYEGLFQGVLDAPAAQAPALGFRAPRVRTLASACAVELHLREPDTAMFALDNVLYTLRRVPRPVRAPMPR
jgi:hypothetical protein